MPVTVFNYPVSKRQLILSLGDLFIINSSIFLSVIIRLGFIDGWIYMRDNPLSFLLTGLTFVLIFFFTELYDMRRDYTSINTIITVIGASATAFVIITFLFYVSWYLRIGRGVFAILCFLITFFIIWWRILYSYLLDQPMFNRNTVIIGAGQMGRFILQEIKQSRKTGLKIIGFLDDDVLKKDDMIDGIPVMGNRYTLSNGIHKYNIQLIVVAIAGEKHPDLIKLLIQCSWNGVDIVDVPTLYEQLTGKIPFYHVDDMWMLQIVIGRSKLYGRLVKPVLETFFALILFVLFIPVMAVIALFVKIGSQGKVLYIQERIGKDNKRFKMIKFRTMAEDAELNTGAVYAADNDARITGIGRFLRKWRLDETPQLFNVIIGNMSLVGPRPERQVFIKEFEEAIPFYRQRLAVRPGLTGWAQVKYPYASSIEQTKEKLQYDLYYIKNMCCLLDLVILLKTVNVVLFGQGK
ncbi:MAG: sugar transferase [wastewater metagenome]|nr:sugar transferase [Candidatus Loosdrechtia aerotolerans]